MSKFLGRVKNKSQARRETKAWTALRRLIDNQDKQMLKDATTKSKEIIN